MSKLFVIENQICKPQEEVLLIEPFKSIWENDNTPYKEIAIKKFTFMELYASKSVSNPYAEYDDKRRLEELSELYLGQKQSNYIMLDEELLKGVQVIQEFQNNGSASMRLYRGLLASVDRLIEHLNELDPDARTNTGAYVIKPVDILNAVAKANDAVISLDALKKKIEQEQLESTRTKGNKVISDYERV